MLHLSMTTAPSFMTHRTPLTTASMSLSGIPFDGDEVCEHASPDSAERLGLTQQLGRDGGRGLERCAGVNPALTNQASSRVFCPKPVKTASEPIPSRTPALTARRADSRFFPM